MPKLTAVLAGLISGEIIIGTPQFATRQRGRDRCFSMEQADENNLKFDGLNKPIPFIVRETFNDDIGVTKICVRLYGLTFVHSKYVNQAIVLEQIKDILGSAEVELLCDTGSDMT